MKLSDAQLDAIAQRVYERQAKGFRELEARTAPPLMRIVERPITPLSASPPEVQEVWRESMKVFLDTLGAIAFDDNVLLAPSLFRSRRLSRAAETAYDLACALLANNMDMVPELLKEVSYDVTKLLEKDAHID